MKNFFMGFLGGIGGVFIIGLACVGVGAQLQAYEEIKDANKKLKTLLEIHDVKIVS